MEHENTYQENVLTIIDLMNKVNTLEFSSEEKEEFTNSMIQDDELMACLISKSKMSIEVQERFIERLRKLVGEDVVLN